MQEQDYYILDYERRMQRDAEQREWEEDPDRVMPDPRPSKRLRASRQSWEKLRRRFASESCRVCGGAWQSLHHIYPRSQGGDDVSENLGPVCGSGTTGCHGRLEARDPEARAAFRASLTDANRWYLTYKLGLQAPAWLDRNYPETQRAAA